MSRADRVAEQIKQDISMILLKEVDDPRIGFITITKVSIPPDLKEAKVFFSVLGNEKQKISSTEGLEAAKRFIKGKLGDMLKLRSVPDITFIFDDSIEKSSKIWNMMSKIK